MKVDKTETIVKFEDGATEVINVIGRQFLPNKDFKFIESILATSSDERATTIFNRSSYGHSSDFVNETKTKVFKYPCVYTINSKDTPTLLYSSTNKNGHFGIPKLIWSNGAGTIVDSEGTYGMTEYAYAIVDTPKNLPLIKKVFDSERFRNFMKACSVGKYNMNYKFISLFRKDFWKEFI